MVTPLAVQNCFHKAGFCLDELAPNQVDTCHVNNQVRSISGKGWKYFFPVSENDSYKGYLSVPGS